MKCPNPTHKKNPVDLQTVRTLANGNTVKRERRCPKCDKQYWTTEELNENIEKKMFEHRTEVDNLDKQLSETIAQFRGTIKILRDFKKMMEVINEINC